VLSPIKMAIMYAIAFVNYGIRICTSLCVKIIVEIIDSVVGILLQSLSTKVWIFSSWHLN